MAEIFEAKETKHVKKEKKYWKDNQMGDSGSNKRFRGGYITIDIDIWRASRVGYGSRHLLLTSPPNVLATTERARGKS